MVSVLVVKPNRKCVGCYTCYLQFFPISEHFQSLCFQIKDFLGKSEVVLEYMECVNVDGLYKWPTKRDVSVEHIDSIIRMLPIPTLNTHRSSSRTQFFSFDWNVDELYSLWLFWLVKMICFFIEAPLIWYIFVKRTDIFTSITYRLCVNYWHLSLFLSENWTHTQY